MDNGRFRDALAVDRHQSIKRWERVAQRASWKRRRAETETPLLPCLWRDGSSSSPTRFHPAALLALFEDDFALVRFNAAGEITGLRLLRSGIPWAYWHPWLLNAYLRGAPVPAPLAPLRRIPPTWIEAVLRRAAAVQAEFFVKLRETGILPGTPKLNSAAISSWMRWEDVRAHFIDFKDNPPTGSGIPEGPSAFQP